MSSQGGGADGDQETQSDPSSHSGTDESVADIMVQFQIPGTPRETIPLSELHAIIEYALLAEQATPSSTSHPEADQLISTLANVSDEGPLPVSSAAAPDQPPTVENSPIVVVHPPAGFVRQENHRPVAAVQPQSAYNLPDIYGQGVLTRGPIPPPRQMVVRGAQPAIEYVPISFAPAGNGPRMTETLRQADVNSLGQTRQMYHQVPPGNPPDREATIPKQLVATTCGSSVPQQAAASVPEHHMYSPFPVRSPVPAGTAARAQQHQVTQPPGPPERYMRPPTAANTQEPSTAPQTTYGTHTRTPHDNLPTEGEIILTPANEIKSLVDDDVETNAPRFNPEQQQQASYAVQQDLDPPSEHDMTSKAGAKSSTAELSTNFSGEDQTHPTICLLFEGIKQEQNLNEESEIGLHEQVLAVHTSCQMPHASRSPSNVLPVAESSKAVHKQNNVPDGHQANYPTCASIPPQQLKAVENTGSTFVFTKPSGISTRDKSTQVNIELEQRGDSPIHNPSKSQRTNAVSYNNPATSSQIPSTAGDTPEMMQTESSFSIQSRSEAEAEEIDKLLALHPNLHRILTSGTRCSGGVLIDVVGMRHSESAGGPADTRGQDHPNGGSPVPRGIQDSLWPGENSGVTQSCVVGTGGGSATTSDGQQSLTTTTPRGGRKRHSDPNEVSSPAGKRQAMVRLGTEFQCTPSSTTFLPQQKDSKPLSVTRETVVDTLGSGALAVTKEQILTRADETTLECDSLKSTGRVVDIRPLIKEKENEVTSDYRQETVLTESVSALQKIHCEHERDDHGDNDVVELASQNATEQYPDEIMAILQQLLGASSDYKKAKNYVGCVTLDSEDRHLELDETETKATQDQNEGESDDVCYVTAIPGKQQVAEEKVNDFPPDEPQSDEKRSICDEHEIQTDKVNDSDSSVAQDVVRISYPIQQVKRIIIEIKLECIIIRDRHYATTAEPSTSDSTPMVQTGQSKKEHGITVEHELSVQTQCAEGSNTSNVQAVGFVGNKYEIVATTGYVPNITSCEAPLTWKVSIEIGQEGITAENRVVHLLIKQPLGDKDFDEKSDNVHEERENECEPVGREDSSSSEMVTRHAQERNMDSDVDCNVPTENEAVQDVITSVVDVAATTEHNEVELIAEDERNSPSEDIDRRSNISDDDVAFNSFGEESSGKSITL